MSRSPFCTRRAAALASLFAALASAFASAAAAQGSQAVLLRDLNTQTIPNPSSNPYNLVRMGNAFYFAARSVDAGYELFRTTGQPGSVQMVRDIRPGVEGSNPAYLTVVGTTLFFTADDGVSGVELWRSDGTAAGTQMVADLNPGAGGSSPFGLTAFGNRLFFSATTPATGAELFVSDGTAAGTGVVLDIVAGPAGSTPAIMRALAARSLLFFSAVDGAGRELWATDGTAAGTRRVFDAFPGSDDGSPTSGTVFGPDLAFTARTGADASTLFTTDGTTVRSVFTWSMTPSLLAPIPAAILGVLNGTLLLSADHDRSGRELWRSNGTAAGTARVVDLNPGGGSDPTSMAVVGGVAVFFATTSLFGRGLFATDGTAANTNLLVAADLLAAAPSGMAPLGNRLVFGLAAGGLGVELWATDGTPAGTGLVKDIEAGAEASFPADLVPFGNGLLFSATTASVGREIWFTDGTASGTQLQVDVQPAPPGTGDGRPIEFTDRFGVSYFQADDGVSGVELWRTDGTPAGTYRVADLLPGVGGASPTRFALVGDLLFFSAWLNADDGQVWRTDGTAVGTFPVTALHASSPQRAVEFRGRAYFASMDAGVFGIYSSDGSAAGTSPLVTFPGRAAVDAYLTPLGARLFFVGWDGSQGRDLWVTDGTTAGTHRVAATTSSGQAARALAALDDRVVFASGGSGGGGLWVSDGTAAGTAQIPGVQAPANLTRVGARVFFSGSDGVRNGLFATDGTPAGTTFLAALQVATPASFTALGADRLLFAVTDPATGTELWASDGTAAGTRMVVDANPGQGSGLRSRIFAAGTRFAWFAGDDGVHGAELWRTDGVTAGLVQDVLPGAASGLAPDFFVDFGLCRGRLLLSANDGISGLEPFVRPLGATSKSFGASCGARGATLEATDPVLGAMLTFTARRAPVGKIGLVKLGLPDPAPRRFAGCLQYVDPTQFTFDFAIRFVTQPTWSTGLPIPNNPGLVDLRLAFQAWYLNASGPPDFELTNGVEAVLGN